MVEAVIRFTGAVREEPIRALMQAVDEAVAAGHKTVRILLSSGGGSVFWGVTAYNHFKGVPAKIVIHNLGSVNSVAVALFCAGEERLAAPHSRFMMHPLTAPFDKSSFERGKLAERLAAMDEDERVISEIISEAMATTPEDIVRRMHDRTFLTADEAVEAGLADRVETELYAKGAKVVHVP